MKQWIRDIGLAMLIVLAITTFTKPTIVHGTSMNPTLQDGYTTGDIESMVVPEGEIFVLGDNQLNSIDSQEIGTQKIDDVEGVAFIRLWPPAAFGKIN